MGLLVDQTQVRKEFLSLRICKQKLPKSKSKENKGLKQKRISKDCETTVKDIHGMGIPEREEEKQKKHLKQ